VLAFRSTARRVWSLGLIVGLLAIPATTQAAPTPGEDRLRRAQALERERDLAAALRILKPVGANTEAGKHRVLLGEAMAAISASAVYSGLDDYERAEAVLEAVLKKLDASRDVHVAMALHRRLAAIGRRERTRTDAEARALLRKAGVLEGQDEHEEAAATYKIVADRPAGEVSEALIQQAKLGRIRAETAALEEEHDPLRRFWHWVKDPLGTVAKWGLYGLLILGIIGLIALGRRAIRRLPPADRTALVLEDLTAPTSERNAKNRVLTRELMTSMKSLGVGGGESSSAEIDETPDLDGTLLVNLKVVGSGLEAFESTIHDGPRSRSDSSPSARVSSSRWARSTFASDRSTS
jgi:tetratricopeptide (TPR) repeat protein